MKRPEPAEPALVCALYSEDAADAAKEFATLAQVVRGMLKRIDERAKSNHLRFRALGRDISGSYWKAHVSKDVGAQQKRRDLVRAVATALLRGHVVFFHVDGDCAWRDQDNAAVWPALERFRRDLHTVLCSHIKAGSGDDRDGPRIEQAFIAVVPFYSMESWLYANTDALCTFTKNADELARIAAWAANPASLDEEEQIKTKLPSIGDRCNAELAQDIPAHALCALGKSYAATVQRLQRSPRILEALAETARRPW